MTKPKLKITPTPRKTFYSDEFTAEELALVAACVSEPSLDDELWMQRVLNHRLFRLTADAPDGEGSDEPIELGMLVRLAEALARGTWARGAAAARPARAERRGRRRHRRRHCHGAGRADQRAGGQAVTVKAKPGGGAAA